MSTASSWFKPFSHSLTNTSKQTAGWYLFPWAKTVKVGNPTFFWLAKPDMTKLSPEWDRERKLNYEGEQTLLNSRCFSVSCSPNLRCLGLRLINIRNVIWAVLVAEIFCYLYIKLSVCNSMNGNHDWTHFLFVTIKNKKLKSQQPNRTHGRLKSKTGLLLKQLLI